MKSPHLLNLGSNPRQIKENLKGILDDKSINLIEEEIKRNALGLFRLGLQFLKFAKRLSNRDWRQKISRLYYASYNIQRCVSLFQSGHYSKDATDHKKIGLLPENFPNSERYKSQLPVLRNDRNLCDYDHTIKINELDLSPKDAQNLVNDFVKDTRIFLNNNGLDLGKIK